MNVWQMLANLALLINDILAVFSLIGTAAMVLDTPRRRTKSRKRRPLEPLVKLSLVTLALAFLGQVAIASNGLTAQPVGVLFRMSFFTVSVLLFVAFLLALARYFIGRKLRERAT